MKNLVLIFISAVFIVSCSNNKNSVVVYTSVDQVFSEPILKSFEVETGIKVKAVYDTEETKSTGVMNRLIAEKNNPQCDVFWSGDPIRSIVLKNKEITYPYKSKKADDISKTFKDTEYYWTGFSARARVLVYNKSLMDSIEIPKSIFDLTKPIYKNKVAIANPLFGTTTFHISALFSLIGSDKATQFLENLKNNDIVIATSNGDVLKRVVKGEVYCGLTDTDDAYEALAAGDDIGVVFLNQEGIGSLIMPNTLSLIANSKNSENAKLLIDYLLTRKTEQALAKSCAQMPLHKGVETPANVPSLDDILPMKIDYDKTSEKLMEIQQYLKDWVDNE